MRRKGFSTLDTIVALFIFAFLFLAIFTVFNQDVRLESMRGDYATFLSIVDNRINDIYGMNAAQVGNLSSETLSTNPSITCTYTTSDTSYQTKKITMVCTLKSKTTQLSRTFVIERSF